MSQIYFRHYTIIAVITALLVGCNSVNSSTPDQSLAPKTIKLESKVFTENGVIPAKYSCDRDNISPPLHWEEIPPGTKSLALIVDDPDAPGATFVHWVLYDLSPEIRQLPEGFATQSQVIGVQGKNDFGQSGYGGPCPPSGTHRYFFKLYALNQKLGLKPGITKQELLSAMTGHILATAELIGKYSRSG